MSVISLTRGHVHQLSLMKTMILSAMLPFLVHIVIISHSAVLVEPVEVSPHGDLLDLPWQTGLCCSSTPAQVHHGGEEEDGGSAPSDTGHPHTLQCLYRNFTSTLGPHPETEPSRATCWDILCRVDETWDNVICDLKHPATSSDTSIPGSVALSLQHLTTLPDIEVNSTHGTDCVGEDSITCSIALHVVSSIVVVTANVSNTTAGPLVMLSVPPRTSQRLWKPSPPLNLTHTQTTEGELILSWSDPQPHASPVQLSYEVRYNTSQSTSHPNWLHVDVSGAQWVSLTGLRPGLQYTLQIRSHHPALPHLWSDWSQQYRIRLENVTYLPERVVASFGDSVTVYCVCNDLRVNASTMVWILNSRDRLPKSQYTAVNDRVSKITVRPSEQRLSDTLHCCQPFGETYSCNYHYSTIYIKDPVIDISCVTSGDLDSMTCRWNNLPIGGINFMSRVADLSCDVMEEAERVGVPVGVVRQAKCESSGYRGVKSCNLQPIRVTSCYKLWMEAKTDNSTRSHPVYITPMDHVKPHPPSGLEAVSMPSGVLKLAWVPPELPIYDMQYQVRYALSTGRAHPFWQVLAVQTESWAEVLEPDVCGVYNVQVRCMHINGSGTWSDWSHLLYTSTHNSRAPDQGPDFWRVFQEDPASTQTNVTLLFKHSPIVEPTYCVEELVVQHQGSGGTVTEEKIGLVSSYSFEWRGEVHSVTVKAQNSQGSSTRNTHMTLDRHPKRQCVRSFSASHVNSSCVVLLWSLQPNCSVPLSLVVEWSGQNHQDRPDQTPESRERWTRFPPTDKLLYLYGHFYETDEYEFILYPVFADGEGEPVYTKVFRGSDAGPAAYMLLMIIAFLSIVLFVTLVISQNHMKKFMWKDVPNPNNCSWAQGIDFGKADTMEQLFCHPEGLPAWPLLLVSETISQATIMEKTGPPTSGSDKDLIPASSPALCVDSEVPGLPEEEESLQLPDLPRSLESSAQPSVTYATVLLSDNPHHLYKQEGSLSSSSDEGNFSGNNSDISGSFPGGLWELEISHSGAGESDLDPRRSCSYNSVEEFSETSEQEDEALGGERDGGIEVIEEKDLYYLGMDCQEESEKEEEEEEDTRAMLLKEVMVLGRGGSSVESIPLLGSQDSMFSEYSDEGSVVGMRSVPLYLPQFRTAPSSPFKAQDPPAVRADSASCTDSV